MSTESTDKKQEIQAYYKGVSESLDGNYSANELAVIHRSVAKGTTNTELAYFLNVCKTMQLNPFNKEVWCYKDNKDNLLIFAGRDGFLAKAQKHPAFNGIRSCEVREKDVFEMNVFEGKINHIVKGTQNDRGQIIGAYAVVFRKDGEPTIEWADFDRYNKGYNAWKSHPEEMIKKVPEAHALKKAFGISGIQSEYEYEVKDNVATPIKTSQDKKAEDEYAELVDEPQTA